MFEPTGNHTLWNLELILAWIFHFLWNAKSKPTITLRGCRALTWGCQEIYDDKISAATIIEWEFIEEHATIWFILLYSLMILRTLWSWQIERKVSSDKCPAYLFSISLRVWETCKKRQFHLWNTFCLTLLSREKRGKCQNKDTIPRTFHTFDSDFSNKKNIVEMKCALRESVKV